MPPNLLRAPAGNSPGKCSSAHAVLLAPLPSVSEGLHWTADPNTTFKFLFPNITVIQGFMHLVLVTGYSGKRHYHRITEL